MPRKKIVFVIVEGTSDDEALGLMFEKFFNNDNVFVHITHGDITAQTEASKTVWSVPYQVYYMYSCLEHVLYDEMNLSDEEKERKSIDFARKYKDNLKGFIEFISSSDFSVVDNYLSSWRLIRIGLHSLERHTNLGLCFTDCAGTG